MMVVVRIQFMNIIDPRTLRIVKGLPPVLSKQDRCAIDTEWFGMDKNRLHRPHGIFACATFCSDGKTVYVVTDVDDLEQAFKNIDPAVHIYVNAKFDITQLRKYIQIPQRKRLWDCFLIEQIMYSGYYNDFSLADLARRRLDLYLPKEIRESFSKNDPEPSGGHLGLSQEQLEYAAVDTAATWQVYQSQRAEIDKNDLSIWTDIELPFLWTLLSMGGVKLDIDAWTSLAEKNGQIAKEIQDEYGHWETIEPNGSKKKSKEVFVGVNLNSPAQVKEHLSGMGYRVKSTDVEVLTELADQHVQFAAEVLGYRKHAKRASTYGKKFIEDYVEADGRIYGDIFQMGAETGRTSSRHPNLQNQPHEVEYRSCFVAGDGNCMVVADWGSQEPRIAAYLSQDERLIEILNSDKKLYIEIARDVFGREITKEMEEYKHIKSTVLGIFYGMSAQGLAVRLGIDEQDAQHMIDKILETYPGIQDYIDRQSKAGDYVQSVYGRKIWLNKYSNQWQRNALNAPIQGSAADAMKIAAYRLVDACDESIYQDSPLRLLVHDEIVCEISEGDVEWLRKTMERIMISVAEELHDGIKGSIEIFSGENWAVKH